MGVVTWAWLHYLVVVHVRAADAHVLNVNADVIGCERLVDVDFAHAELVWLFQHKSLSRRSTSCNNTNRRSSSSSSTQQQHARSHSRQHRTGNLNKKPKEGNRERATEILMKMKIYVKNEGKREKHLWNTPIHLD
jgi:hypothetical protein